LFEKLNKLPLNIVYECPKISCDVAIIIPSIIHISNKNIQNIFTPQERFEQTINQLESLKRIKNITVILVELSLSLSDKEKLELSKRCDYLYILNDELSLKYAHQNDTNKSLGELYALYKVITNIDCKYFFKFGGRYSILDTYKIEHYFIDKPVAQFLESQNLFQGIFFSIPKKYIQTFIKHLNDTFEKKYITTERMLTNFMIETEGHHIFKLGVKGTGAVSGITAEY
jgi:hypothetical protein